MTSAAQLEANQQNAQLSTGPITEAGKQKSRLNALKHGFLARVLPHEKEDYHELLAGLYRSFSPQDEFQRTLVDQIAIATIRLRRIYQAEIELVDRERKRHIVERTTMSGNTTVESREERDAPLPVGEFLRSETTRNMIRYEVMCQRQIQRNVKLLESLKGDVWEQYRKQPCPYLEPEEPSADPSHPSDPSGPTPFETVEDSVEFADLAEVNLPELLARSRNERRREAEEFRAIAGKGPRNRHRKRPGHKNGFVSQNPIRP